MQLGRAGGDLATPCALLLSCRQASVAEFRRQTFAADERRARVAVSPACSHPHHCDTVRGRALDDGILSGLLLFAGIVGYR
jgi:hypothetical protein